MPETRIAIIGFGKIAADQHVPAIRADPRFRLVAGVSTRPIEADVPIHATVADLLARRDTFDAVAICTPPAPRHEIACQCIEAGLHVLLEKPTAATLGEAEDIVAMASARGKTLFTTWHAQHNAAVTEAAVRLSGRSIRSMKIEWREDVRKWHLGQQWIWEPGGFGVFDPGINALSIASRIIPAPLLVRSAGLEVPSNRQAPIAARASLESAAIADGCEGIFDWRHGKGECWTIEIATTGGRLMLLDGGKRLVEGDREIIATGDDEYPAIYRRFGDLIAAGESDIDLQPLRLVADIFLRAERTLVESFDE